MIVARFADAESLVTARKMLSEAGIAAETRTPIALPVDENGTSSRLPLAALIVGLLCAAAAFGMQCYATMVSYRFNIGGRPAFFWTSYLVYAFECGVLGAVLTAFFGFFAANRMPALYDRGDDDDELREATRDGWFLIVEGNRAEIRPLLRRLRPLHLSDLNR